MLIRIIGTMNSLGILGVGHRLFGCMIQIIPGAMIVVFITSSPHGIGLSWEEEKLCRDIKKQSLGSRGGTACSSCFSKNGER